MKKTIIISLFLLLLIPFTNVFADSVDTTQAAYGYFYYDTNHTKHTVNWSGYDSNYKFRGLADFPATSDDGIYIVDFGLRFHINGNFKANKKYALTFNWVNYNQNYLASSDSFLRQYSYLSETIHCRETSFTSTSYDESHCYNNSEFVVSPGADEKMAVTVTWYFTPKVDFYTGIIYYFHDSNAVVSNYFTEGWEINNISWTDVTNDAQNIINNQNQNTQNIINNQNTNSQNIINNQNTNTQNIINNQNTNTQAIIDSNKNCKLIDKNYIETDNYYLTASGGLNPSSDYGVTGYFSTTGSEFTVNDVFSGGNYCTYGPTKFLVQCYANSSMTVGQKLTFSDTVKYVRFTIKKAQNKPQIKMCQNGSQAIEDTLTDSNTTEANSDAGNFFSGFTTDTYGLSSIITAPLTLIQSITSSTCTPLVLPLPFVNQNLTLPCMSQVYSQNFGSFLTIYQTITYGIIAYWVVVRIFNLVKDFKNPDHDEIEVMEL